MRKGRARLFELPEPRAGEPIYQCVARRIRELIFEGAISAGARLPAQRILAQDLRVSRNTILAALQQLISEGLLESRAGSGTYVAKDAAPFARARAARAAGRVDPIAEEGLLPLDVGTPDLSLFPASAWQKVQASVWKRLPRDAFSDSYIAGWPGLRSLISSRLSAIRGLDFAPERIVIVPSAQAAFALAARALTRPGEPALMEDPGYFRARRALKDAGLSVVDVPVDGEGMIVDGVVDARIAYVTPCAQFPTGVEMSPARRRQILRWALTKDAWIVEDDFESDFCFDGRAPLPLAAEPDSERVIYVGTFNNLVFPSVRIAFLAAPDAALDRILAACATGPRLQSIPTQLVLQEFIEQGHLAAHIRTCREVYGERRSALVDALRGLPPQFELAKPRQGLLLQVQIPAIMDDGSIKRAAARRNVVVSAVSEHTHEAHRRGLFLGYAAHAPQSIAKAAQILLTSIDEAAISAAQ